MADTLSKRVSLIELFYDLVFVYMVSQATGLIHHLHHGVVSLTTLGIFFLVVIVFINSWMVQMVFTNRYGKSSWTNIIFSFVDMAIVLYMSNAFTATFDRKLATFFIAAGLLSLTLCLQYLITYFQAKKEVDKKITVAFTGKYTRHHPIIFSHILERLTALIIVMFGETIVGIADYFTRETLSWPSILIFLVVVGLFFTYIVEFDHLIDEHRRKETGNLLIYLHYFILFGLSMVTVALRFIHEPEANHVFAVSFLYVGIALFYIGLDIANYYNQRHLRVSPVVKGAFIAVTLAGYLVSLTSHEFALLTLVAALVTVINAGMLVRFLIKQD